VRGVLPQHRPGDNRQDGHRYTPEHRLELLARLRQLCKALVRGTPVAGLEQHGGHGVAVVIRALDVVIVALDRDLSVSSLAVVNAATFPQLSDAASHPATCHPKDPPRRHSETVYP
jgi:hypothetical protein